MKQIGITGGIGSGKSIVCKIFKVLGIPIYDADLRAKALYTEDNSLKEEVIQLLGQQSYFENGHLNSAFISSNVFNNPELLRKLNELVHPRVKLDYQKWVSNQKSKSPPYLLREAALLFEAQTAEGLDAVIFVDAPEPIRINRVLKRDAHRTKADVKVIISKQWPESKKRALSNFIITNDEKHLVIPQVLQIDQQVRDSSYSVTQNA